MTALDGRKHRDRTAEEVELFGSLALLESFFQSSRSKVAVGVELQGNWTLLHEKAALAVAPMEDGRGACELRASFLLTVS